MSKEQDKQQAAKPAAESTDESYLPMVGGVRFRTREEGERLMREYVERKGVRSIRIDKPEPEPADDDDRGSL